MRGLCENCIHHDVCDFYRQEGTDGFTMNCPFHEEERSHGEWIPCSERLPKKFGVYLVTTEEGKVFEYDYNILTVHLKKWSFCRKEIVAWMPLPEPYKKEGEEK